MKTLEVAPQETMLSFALTPLGATLQSNSPSSMRYSYAQLSPEPYQPSIDKLDLKQFYSLSIPKSYLYCTEDTALPQGEWGWHPRMSNRLGQFRLVQMSGGHEVMFSNPIGLAEKIIVAGRD